MSAPFAGGASAIDAAVVMAALGQRLGRAGMPVTLTATERAAAAFTACPPASLDELYWQTRLSFVSDRSHLDTFDRVFRAVFDHDIGWANAARNSDTSRTRDDGDRHHRLRTAAAASTVDGGGLPWATRPPVAADDDAPEATELGLPELVASMAAGDPDRAFDTLDDAELAAAGRLLEAMVDRWPHRPSRRLRPASGGSRPQLRAALRRALRTGGEPFVVPMAAPRPALRPVVLLVDVSGSMESYARAYLHMARALATGGRAEVFAFATGPSRITPALRLRSPAEAIERASAQVGDRFGGTRLATTLQVLLTHRVWGTLVRGAVVVIVSDGCDTDPPDELARQMVRLRRRVRRIVWVNPRLAAAGYEPLVAAMAAALPHCDRFLPGHSLTAMADVLDAISDGGGPGPSRGRSLSPGRRPGGR